MAEAIVTLVDYWPRQGEPGKPYVYGWVKLRNNVDHTLYVVVSIQDADTKRSLRVINPWATIHPHETWTFKFYFVMPEDRDLHLLCRVQDDTTKEEIAIIPFTITRPGQPPGGTSPPKIPTKMEMILGKEEAEVGEEVAVTVRLYRTDTSPPKPLEGMRVILKVDNTKVGEQDTDKNGYVAFTITVPEPPPDRDRVVVTAEFGGTSTYSPSSVAKTIRVVTAPPTPTPERKGILEWLKEHWYFIAIPIVALATGFAVYKLR